jgi:hypothetical protein
MITIIKEKRMLNWIFRDLGNQSLILFIDKKGYFWCAKHLIIYIQY